MPAERISMRKACEIIRLSSTAISAHEVFPASRHAALDGAGDDRARGERQTVLAAAGGNGDDALAEALYAARRSKRGHRRAEEPDWAGVHRELKRKHVTLTILWDEYIAANPGGCSYSRFCELYRAFEKSAVGHDAADARRRRGERPRQGEGRICGADRRALVARKACAAGPSTAWRRSTPRSARC